jgi:hypothetical protein
LQGEITIHGDKKMKECAECGKRLGFFNGYYHPILGKKNMVCGHCFLRVDESVAQWREFVLSNSFNPESAAPTLSIDWSSLFKRFTKAKKQFTESNEKKNPQTIQIISAELNQNILRVPVKHARVIEP